MFQSLTDRLNAAFKKFRNKGKLTEADVKEGMREIKLALLEADVNFKVVKEFIKTVSERAVGAQVLESITAPQQIVKIVNEELTALMGGSNSKLDISPKISAAKIKINTIFSRSDGISMRKVFCTNGGTIKRASVSTHIKTFS